MILKREKIRIATEEATKILIAVFRDNKLKNGISSTVVESGEYFHLHFDRINGLPEPPKE